MGPQSAVRSDTGTREKILDAAEALFIEHGYSATSMRAIAQQAQVNLAATNYHFGSKYGLLAAVFHRRIQPIDDARLAALDALEATGQSLTVRQIVEAFLGPILNLDADPESLERLPRLAGRILGEPESLTKPLLEAEFTEVAGRYQQALSVARRCPIEEVQWGFHFMIGGMIHLMRLQAPLGRTPSPHTLREGMRSLVDFAVAGMSYATPAEDAL